MTRYGWGANTQEGYKISAEVSTVNRKQAEINIYLPRELEPLEARARTEVNKRIARGRVTARITLHAAESALVSRAQINSALAKAYARELKKLAVELKISSELTLDTLVRAPGIFQADTALDDADHFWPAIESALQKALEACVKMRVGEGIHLSKDLKSRIATMRKGVAKVQKEATAMMERYRA